MNDPIHQLYEVTRGYWRLNIKRALGALLKIGIIYENGNSDIGIVRDIEKAIYFYNFSMDQKSVFAPINLCNILFNDSIYGDKVLARNIVSRYLDVFKKYAHLSSGIIPYNVATYFLNDHFGIQDRRKNFEQGLEWVELAARFGNENAIRFLRDLDNRQI